MPGSPTISMLHTTDYNPNGIVHGNAGDVCNDTSTPMYWVCLIDSEWGPLNCIWPDTVSGEDQNPNGALNDASDGIASTLKGLWYVQQGPTAATVTALAGPSFPIVIETSVNDEFSLGTWGTCVLPAGTYNTLEDIENAMNAMSGGATLNGGAIPLNGVCAINDDGTHLIFYMQIQIGPNIGGAFDNGNEVTEGNGALALLGFENGQPFGGGANAVWLPQLAPTIPLGWNEFEAQIQVLNLPDDYNAEEGTYTFAALLLTGDETISNLSDQYGNPIPDGWQFLATIFVVGGVIYDIMAFNPYFFGAGGGIVCWSSPGGQPSMVLSPSEIFLPNMPASDLGLEGTLWADNGIIVQSGYTAVPVPATLFTHKATFAYDTPNLAIGAIVTFDDGYTPAIGDILHDAWIEIDTPWDGTTPLGDFGSSLGSEGIINALITSTIDMTTADIGDAFQPGWLSAINPQQSLAASAVLANRPAQQKFTAANPIQVIVSTDGTTTGDDPGSTQGAAVLYIVTSTPA